MPSWKKVIISGSNADLLTVTASIFAATNNGNGTNYKVGDDAWIGDINSADTIGLKGQQNSNNAYLSFGSDLTTLLGRAGTGPLTWGGKEVLTATGSIKISGSLSVTGSVNIASGSNLYIGQVTTTNEATLVLGIPPAGGSGEGGQLALQPASGFTSGSFIDQYQSGIVPYFRVLRGSATTSDAILMQLNNHTKQFELPAYNSTTAFTGSVVGLLAFDSSGKIITTTTGSGGGAGVTINNNTNDYIVTATGTANTLNGETNLRFNGTKLTITGTSSAKLYDVEGYEFAKNTGGALLELGNISGADSDVKIAGRNYNGTNSPVIHMTDAEFIYTEALHTFNGSVTMNTLSTTGPVISTAGALSSVTGYTGFFTVPTNPPGQQTLDIQNGIIVNVL